MCDWPAAGPSRILDNLSREDYTTAAARRIHGNRIVAEKLNDIRSIAERYGVRRLDLFGSAVGNEFDLEFVPTPPDGRADSYVGLIEELRNCSADRSICSSPERFVTRISNVESKLPGSHCMKQPDARKYLYEARCSPSLRPVSRWRGIWRSRPTLRTNCRIPQPADSRVCIHRR